ncbi:FecR family protein [Bacteroides sp.]|uniref:FecR family protein n=1 Tax=Bacteroides sp. TaxID=29523 RepID=UPI003AB1BBBC
MDQNIENIILKTLLGESTVEEQAELSTWLDASDKNRQQYEKLKGYWNSNIESTDAQDPLAVFQLVEKKIHSLKPRKITIRTYLKYAAFIVAILLTGSVGFYWEHQETRANKKETTLITGSSVASFILPDGTQVSLNKNSALTYTSAYGEEIREVSLVGEACFNVTHHAKKKFIVQLDGSSITVLGTVFNVKYYPDNEESTTTLLEGTIQFSTPEQNIILKPNQQLIYNRNTQTMMVDSVQTDIVTAWKDNLIRYRSTSFANVIEMLKEQYGVDIVIANRLLKEKIISGSFDRNSDIEQILDLLKINIAFNWKNKEGKYIIE